MSFQSHFNAQQAQQQVPQEQEQQQQQQSPSRFPNSFSQYNSNRGGSVPSSTSSPLNSIPRMEDVFSSEQAEVPFQPDSDHDISNPSPLFSDNQPGKIGFQVDFNDSTQFLIINGEEYFFHSETKSFINCNDPDFCSHFIKWREYLADKALRDLENARSAELERQFNAMKMAQFFPNQGNPTNQATPPPPKASFLQSRRVNTPPVVPFQQQSSIFNNSHSSSMNQFSNSSTSNFSTKPFTPTPTVCDRFCNVCGKTPASQRYPTCKSCYQYKK